MKKKMLFLTLLCVAVISTSATAATVGWWRFEEGPHGALVPKTVGGYTYEPSIPDSSGNGYELTVWDMGGAGQVYRSQVATSLITRLGLANNFSSKNNGGGPCMWTNPADPISTMTPAQWTVEATFKLENGGYKTIVGRDARGITTDGSNYDNAAMYFQAVPNNGLAIKFVDAAGHFHEAVAPANSYIGFDWGTDPDGTNAPWYSMAATSDGSTLSLYLLQHGVDRAYKLIAQTDMTTVNPSPNTALHNGAGGVAGTGDWTAGEFTVARGLWAGGHGDRAYGFIDEVRISDTALSPNDFLMSSPASPVYPAQDEYLVSTAPITYTWTAELPEQIAFDSYTFYVADAPADLTTEVPTAYLDTMVITDELVTEYSSALTYDYGEDYYWRIDMTAMDPNYAVPDPNFPEYNIPVLYQGGPVRFFGPRACAAMTISGDVVNVPDPATQIFVPQDAVFTSMINRGTVNVAAISWYKVLGTQDNLETADPNDQTDIEITTGISYDPDLATATSTTLTIAAASPADNGDYYARVRLVDPIGSGSGCETNSPTANLFVRDDTNSGTNYLVHRYGFAADAADSIGSAHGVVADLDDPNHAFVDGQIVLFNGNLNSRPLQEVQVPDPTPEDPNNTLTMQQLLDQPGAYVDLPNGTISALGKTATFMVWFTYDAADTGDWPRLFDFGTSTAGEGFSTGGDGVQYLDGDPTPYLDTSAEDAQEYIMMSPKRGAGPGWRYESVSRPGSPVSHLIDPAGTGASQIATAPNEACVACVFDGANGVMTVYVNGVQVGQNTNLNHDLADLTDVNNWLGRSAWADAMFSGSINEFRIYNVALSEPWVEAYYKQGPDDYLTTPDPCLVDYNPMDFDENCIVDIDDFAEFAAQWLDCGKLSCN